MLKRIAQWFSPKARFVAQHQALGTPPEHIEMLWGFRELERKASVQLRRLYQAENPLPLPETEFLSHDIDWIGHRRALAEHEARYQEYLEEEEEDARRREREEEEEKERSAK